MSRALSGGDLLLLESIRFHPADRIDDLARTGRRLGIRPSDMCRSRWCAQSGHPCDRANGWHHAAANRWATRMKQRGLITWSHYRHGERREFTLAQVVGAEPVKPVTGTNRRCGFRLTPKGRRLIQEREAAHFEQEIA